nr:HAMP domain-containing sensor histidine kinase [Pseudomonas sp. R5(2019)]
MWRINLWVTGFFTLVTLGYMFVLLHQAVTDVEREMQAADAVVHYLGEAAERDPASLQPHLTGSLRHVRVSWLADGETGSQPMPHSLDAWFGRQMFAQARHPGRVLELQDGRRVLIAVDPRDEIDEVWDSLQQLLGLCALTLLLSLLSIRWALRRGLRVLDALLAALQQVSRGQLQVRLRSEGGPESRQLAGHFNRMTATLEQVQADNGQLTRTLLAVQEQERTQLAQTLHDDLGQYVAGIRAQSCLLRMLADRPQVLEQTVCALERDCEHLQQGFRALVRDLYPVVVQHLPLSEAFAVLVEQWRSSHGIDCQLRIGKHLPALPVASKTHLYRLLQEALTNVARHAQASQVRIRLQRRGGRLWLLIRDNGCGAPQPQRPGVGLYSMFERARSLDGQLRVISQPGAGWALALSIPAEG